MMTGSLRSSSSTELVLVGRIGPPHGLDGTVYLQPDSDDPTRFAPGADLLVGKRRMRVEKLRRTPDRLFVKFAEVPNRNSAEKLRGLQVFIAEHQRRKLDDEEFWPDQLEGLGVRTLSGQSVGRVKGVLVGDAQNRLVIETASGMREVPFVDELVPVVNLEEGYLSVSDLPGLL